MQNGNTEANSEKSAEGARPAFAANGRAGDNNGRAGGDRGGDRGSYSDRGGSDRGGDRGFGDKPYDRPKGGPMEVAVDHNVDKAMKVLKRKLIREGLFKELKLRRYFEKPSEKRKRKAKESIKKLRKEEARNKKNPFIG